MLFDFANVFLFIVVSFLFVFICLFLAKIVAPKDPVPDKFTTYECGERPIGPGWIRFNIRFYIIALIFLIFDVEMAIMFPCITVFHDWANGKVSPTVLKFIRGSDYGIIAFIEIFFFVGILLVGLAYVWKKGDLEWIKTYRNEKSEV